MTSFIEIALYSSLFSYVYIGILQDDNMLLDWLPHKTSFLPNLIWKPLIGCIPCNSGQIALWWSIVSELPLYDVLRAVALSILFARIVTFAMIKLMR